MGPRQRSFVRANDNVWVRVDETTHDTPGAWQVSPSVRASWVRPFPSRIVVQQNYLPKTGRPVYFPAIVKSEHGSRVLVDTIYEPVQSLEVPITAILPMSKTDEIPEDLELLQPLHEVCAHMPPDNSLPETRARLCSQQAVMHTLYERYLASQMHTLAGRNLVVVSPNVTTPTSASKLDRSLMELHQAIEQSLAANSEPEEEADVHAYGFAEMIHLALVTSGVRADETFGLSRPRSCSFGPCRAGPVSGASRRRWVGED
jgi:hypothetical protein